MVISNRGEDLMAKFRKQLEDGYGFAKSAITTENTQANSVLEIVHQPLGNIVKAFFKIRKKKTYDMEFL